jgi:hypothetical protein
VSAELCDTSHQSEIVILLLFSSLIKVILLVFTVGLKIPGGVFIPSLCIGALFGRAVGITVQQVHEYLGDIGPFEACAKSSVCIKPAIYAIVGAASVLGGVTRMAVSLVVVMMEVTDGMQYVIPLMVGIMMSKWVGDAFGRGTIYTESIKQQGYPLLDHETIAEDVDASEETVWEIAGGRQVCVYYMCVCEYGKYGYMYMFVFFVYVYVGVIVGDVDASEETVGEIAGGRQVCVRTTVYVYLCEYDNRCIYVCV